MKRNTKWSVGNLIDRFLSASKSQMAPTTLAWYANYLNSFRAFAAGSEVSTVTPAVVYEWLAKSHKHKSPSTQHAAARSVVRLMNWAVEEHLIERSPLATFRKPTPGSREIVLTGAQYAACVKQAQGSLRKAIKFLWHTGCRPQEYRIIEAKWIEGNKIVLPKELSKGKRRRRVIYMDPIASAIAHRTAKARPAGPIFRNSKGEPWKKDSFALAFRRLGDRAGVPGLCAYSLRHAFITRLLEAGTDVASVAAIAGNSPRMVLEVYSHVHENEERLLRHLRRA